MVTFKRFIGTGSLVAALLTFSLSAGACVSEAPRHNNYLFSVFNRSAMDDRFMSTTDKYWQQYLGDNNAHYQWDYYRDLVLKKAVKQKDTEPATTAAGSMPTSGAMSTSMPGTIPRSSASPSVTLCCAICSMSPRLIGASASVRNTICCACVRSSVSSVTPRR